jgi:hypothetical protein
MTEPLAGLVVGVLGQWASGKSEAARTLIHHLGGAGHVEFITDRGLWVSLFLKHVLEREDSEFEVSVDEDGRQRVDCDLATFWLQPGEELRRVEPASLRFQIHDDDVTLAFRRRGKMALGPQIRERSAAGKPVVIETAYGPNRDEAGEDRYGRTIADLFARLEGAGVDPRQVKWIIVTASAGTRAERNARRPDRIPPDLFAKLDAEGGDLAPEHERRLLEQGALIRRVDNDHDDVDRFRADVVAAFEDMLGGDSP